MASAYDRQGDLLHVVEPHRPDPNRRLIGRWLVWSTFLIMITVAVAQYFHVSGQLSFGFENWRPFLYAYLLWCIALGASRILIHGEKGKRALFVLPGVMFVAAIVIFPLAFGLYISFSDWNLSSLTGRKFNGLDNVRQMINDAYYWNAILNMGYHVLAIAVEYATAFGLALLLNSEIRARRFFRVVFLLPLMLSPVAVSWMIGKSMLEIRWGPLASLARTLGWENPAFFFIA